MLKLSNIWGFSCWKKIISINFLQQWCTSQNIYCQEAVDSVTVVESCPTSKEEWDSAAFKKNCIRIAARQNCINAREKFQYHCVINGLRNELLEVCAPTRIIFSMYAAFLNTVDKQIITMVLISLYWRFIVFPLK